MLSPLETVFHAQITATTTLKGGPGRPPLYLGPRMDYGVFTTMASTRPIPSPKATPSPTPGTECQADLWPSLRSRGHCRVEGCEIFAHDQKRLSVPLQARVLECLPVVPASRFGG